MRANAIYLGRIVQRPDRLARFVCRQVAGHVVLLNPRLDIRAFAKQFGWGNNAPPSAQAALAILADLFSGEEDADGQAYAWHDRFAMDVIAKLAAGREWTLSGDQILEWMESVREELAEHQARERFEMCVGEAFDGLS